MKEAGKAIIASSAILIIIMIIYTLFRKSWKLILTIDYTILPVASATKIDKQVLATKDKVRTIKSNVA